MKLYSLFQREGKRYTRVSSLALPKQNAVRVFQTRLLDGAFSGVPLSLRPVNDTQTETGYRQPECRNCFQHLHTQCTKQDCQCNCRVFDPVT